MARLVTVFGGTGFLGRHIVRRLRAADFAVRVAVRDPQRQQEPDVEAVRADVNDDAAAARAVIGADGVVNAVSLYVERGGETFRSVHVIAAGRVARLAREAGAALVHVSGIGADPASSSAYIRSRGEGEDAVRQAFPAAAVIRPAVMFGVGDAFATALARLTRMPALPLFGLGDTRLQPAWVEDIALAVARILADPAPPPVYELAGPRVYRYLELLRVVAAAAGRRPLFVPLPFAVWHAMAFAAEFAPGVPLARNQVELMEHDTTADPALPGLAALGITPRSLEGALPEILAAAGI